MPADAMEHATAGMQPLDEASGEPPILPEPSGWRERMRIAATRLVELWRDESSGSPEGWGWLGRVRETLSTWWSGAERGKPEAPETEIPSPVAQPAPEAPRDEADAQHLPHGAEPEDYSWPLAHEHRREHEPGGDQARLLRHTQPEEPDGAARQDTVNARPRPARAIDAAWESAAEEVSSSEADASGLSPEEPEPGPDKTKEPDEPDMG